MSRHLLYHIMPIASTNIWQWNLDLLKPRLPLFDGQRVCAIVTQKERKEYTGTARRRDWLRVSPITHDADAVIEQLKPYGFKFIVMENDPNLSEVLTLEPLMRHVENFRRYDDYTLYSHAKAVTRFRGHPAIPWTQMIYESMLDYWPVVEEALKRSPTAGSFLKFGQGWLDCESTSKWHYSGSWFWFRNACLFAKPDWPRIDNFWSGSESYPSLHFDTAECATVFHEGDTTGPNAMDLYNLEYLERVKGEFEEWKLQNSANRTDISFSETWCPTI